MKKHLKVVLLLSLSSMFLLSGCRRKPIEEIQMMTEVITETETATEKLTEAATEKKVKKDKKQAETAVQTEVQTEAQTEKKANTQKRKANKQTEKSTESESAKSTVKPSTPAPSQGISGDSDICPYCGGSFSTYIGESGSSEYSEHVGQEEAYISYMNGQGGYTGQSDAGTASGGAGTSQCPYCWQWFDNDNTWGYSEYQLHIQAEEAGQQVEYNPCPYCGLWLEPGTLNDHIANGY